MKTYADLEREIWGDDPGVSHNKTIEDMLDPLVAGFGVAASKLDATSEKLQQGHRQTAVEMAALLGELAAMMREHADRVANAVAGLGTQSLTASIKALEARTEIGNKAVSGMLQSLALLASRVEGIERALMAPRHIVTDAQGKPIGVRIG